MGEMIGDWDKVPSGAARNLWLFVGGPHLVQVYLPLAWVAVFALTVDWASSARAAAMITFGLMYLYCGVRMVTARLFVSEEKVRFVSLVGWREVEIEAARSGELLDVSIGLKYSRLCLVGTSAFRQPLVLLTRAKWREVLRSDGPGGDWIGDQKLFELYHDLLISPAVDDDSTGDLGAR
jgi:hypothetical protein